MNTALEQDHWRKTDDRRRVTGYEMQLAEDEHGKQNVGVAAETEPPGSAEALRLCESDDDIIARIRNGDMNAFELLMRRYKHWVFGIVSKHMAYHQMAETAQDVFIQAYRSLPRYSPRSRLGPRRLVRHSSLSDGGSLGRMNTSFKQWLALIAGRCCCHHWRVVNRHSTCAISNLSVEDREQMETVCEEAACAAFHAETDSSARCAAVRAAMDSLGANDQRILKLLYIQNYSLQETAVMLGYTLVNARVRACRARNALRTLLKPAAVTKKPLALVNPVAPSNATDQNPTSEETPPIPAWLITAGRAVLQHNYA